jgi:hypothetical protein
MAVGTAAEHVSKLKNIEFWGFFCIHKVIAKKKISLSRLHSSLRKKNSQITVIQPENLGNASLLCVRFAFGALRVSGPNFRDSDLIYIA